MKKKITGIAAIVLAALMAVLLVTMWNAWKAKEAMQEAVDACNEAVREYNERIAPYNEAVKQAAEANGKLQAVLDKAQAQIDSGEKAYDEDTLDELARRVKKASKAFVEIPQQIEPYEPSAALDSFDKKELEAAANKAREDEKAVREAIAKIPEPVKVPDYGKEISSVEKALAKYTDSVRMLANVTAPEDAFVSERLRRIETVTGTAAVTKDNDPNRLLGTEGGYRGCVYFRDERLNPEELPGEIPSLETIALLEKMQPAASEEEGEKEETDAVPEDTASESTSETAAEALSGSTSETAAEALSGSTAAAALAAADEIENAENALAIIAAGTAGGGAVEVFSTKEEARERDRYLAFFEGSVMDPGGHTVEGTCVIRVSRHFEEADQHGLMEKIREALLSPR